MIVVYLDLVSRKITPRTAMSKKPIIFLSSYPDLVPFLHFDVGLIWGTNISRTYTSSVAMIKRDWIPIMNYFRDKIFSRCWKYFPVERINSFYCSCKLSGLLIISLSVIKQNLVKYHRFLIFQILKVFRKWWLESNIYKNKRLRFQYRQGINVNSRHPTFLKLKNFKRFS